MIPLLKENQLTSFFLLTLIVGGSFLTGGGRGSLHAASEDYIGSSTLGTAGVLIQSFEISRHFYSEDQLESNYFLMKRSSESDETDLAPPMSEVTPFSWSLGFGYSWLRTTSKVPLQAVITDTLYTGLAGLTWEPSPFFESSLIAQFDTIPFENYQHYGVALRFEYAIALSRPKKSHPSSLEEEEGSDEEAIEYYRRERERKLREIGQHERLVKKRFKQEARDAGQIPRSLAQSVQGRDGAIDKDEDDVDEDDDESDDIDHKGVSSSHVARSEELQTPREDASEERRSVGGGLAGQSSHGKASFPEGDASHGPTHRAAHEPQISIALFLQFNSHLIGAKTFRDPFLAGLPLTSSAVLNQFRGGPELNFTFSRGLKLHLSGHLFHYSSPVDSFLPQLELGAGARQIMIAAGGWSAFANQVLAFPVYSLDQTLDWILDDRNTLFFAFNQTSYASKTQQMTLAFSPSFYRDFNRYWRAGVSGNVMLRRSQGALLSAGIELIYKF